MKTPFVECEGALYIAIRASGIHPLIPYFDGMSVSTFGKGKTVYLKLDDAIAWHEKELTQSRGASGSKQTLENLKKARARLTTDLPKKLDDKPAGHSLEKGSDFSKKEKTNVYRRTWKEDDDSAGLRPRDVRASS